MNYYTYILYSKTHDIYYVGHTKDWKQRITRHNNGLEIFTSKFRPWEFVLILKKNTKNEAYLLELKIKNLNRVKLLKFIDKYRMESIDF